MSGVAGDPHVIHTPAAFSGFPGGHVEARLPAHPRDNAEPAAADIQAIDANINSGELVAALPPLVLVMHDSSRGSQVRSCSCEPSRGNQYLGRCQDAHHHSMSTCGAR